MAAKYTSITTLLNAVSGKTVGASGVNTITPKECIQWFDSVVAYCKVPQADDDKKFQKALPRIIDDATNYAYKFKATTSYAGSNAYDEINDAFEHIVAELTGVQNLYANGS